jgi:hypothetical protein
MATAPATSSEKEAREHDKSSTSSSGTSPIVVVELDEPQSTTAVRRLRKGKGKLFTHVEHIIKDLTDDGTIKANAQPVVIVVQEMPASPWEMFSGKDDEDDED